VAVGYLRGFARLLVFALHSAAAYYSGPYPPVGRAVLHQSIPVLDTKHFAGARILVAFNEISLMSLLFFLSGLFLWPSLSRKGAAAFLRERLVRLGAPFLVCGGLVAAIAYYPSYLLTAPPHPSLADYASAWLAPDRWTTGPAWFLLILLIFDLVAIGLYAVIPTWGSRLAGLAAGAAARPLRFCLLAMLASGLAYIPLALIFGPYDWWHASIFWLQKSRALEYAVYFTLGIAVGAFGLDRGLLAKSGQLARRWAWFGLAAIVAFLIVANLIRTTINHHTERDLIWGTLADAGWVVCCALCSFALLAIFVRFARRSRLLDNFANNSYGMYIVHYMFVTWTQYALLKAHLPAVAKWGCVLVVTIAGSWALAGALRRIPIIARNV
jgi:peptidoglycan/LPS O-acetylase OafA/YrhL